MDLEGLDFSHHELFDTCLKKRNPDGTFKRMLAAEVQESFRISSASSSIIASVGAVAVL
jgi:hypothetical protein